MHRKTVKSGHCRFSKYCTHTFSHCSWSLSCRRPEQQASNPAARFPFNQVIQGSWIYTQSESQNRIMGTHWLFCTSTQPGRHLNLFQDIFCWKTISTESADNFSNCSKVTAKEELRGQGKASHASEQTFQRMTVFFEKWWFVWSSFPITLKRNFHLFLALCIPLHVV